MQSSGLPTPRPGPARGAGGWTYPERCDARRSASGTHQVW